MRSVRRRGHTRPAGEHQAQGLREFVAVEPEQHGLALGEPVVERPLAWAYHSALASQDQPHLIDFDGSAAHVRNLTPDSTRAPLASIRNRCSAFTLTSGRPSNE